MLQGVLSQGEEKGKRKVKGGGSSSWEIVFSEEVLTQVWHSLASIAYIGSGCASLEMCVMRGTQMISSGIF